MRVPTDLGTPSPDKRRSTGYSTAKLCRSVASGVCGLAVRRDAMRSNPVRDVSRLEKRGEREARALSPEERREWLAILDSSELARRKDLPDFTRFLLGTGCRLGQGVGVLWEDRDLDRHLPHVRRTVFANCSPHASRNLRKRRAPVFADRHGGYRDRDNIEADYRKVRLGTAFEWVVPHVYRKTVASMLDQDGLSARLIADQLGHSRISMTQDVYLGRRAVDGSVASALDGLFDVVRPSAAR